MDKNTYDKGFSSFTAKVSPVTEDLKPNTGGLRSGQQQTDVSSIKSNSSSTLVGSINESILNKSTKTTNTHNNIDNIKN